MPLQSTIFKTDFFDCENNELVPEQMASTARCTTIRANSAAMFLGFAVCAACGMLPQLRALLKNKKTEPSQASNLERSGGAVVEKDSEGEKYELDSEALRAEVPQKNQMETVELEGDVGIYHELEGSSRASWHSDRRRKRLAESLSYN